VHAAGWEICDRGRLGMFGLEKTGKMLKEIMTGFTGVIKKVSGNVPVIGSLQSQVYATTVPGRQSIGHEIVAYERFGLVIERIRVGLLEEHWKTGLPWPQVIPTRSFSFYGKWF